MLLTAPRIDPMDLERRTGWSIKPQGACLGDICVPLPTDVRNADGTLDAAGFAERMRMPLVHDDAHGVWALGPASGGRALSTADMPDLELPDLDGNPFRLRSLLGKKVVLAAWASW
jgi:hypothetical protein